MSTVDLDRLTLPQQLRHWAATRPGEVALRQKDFGIWEPVTWAGYEQAARYFGLGLVDLGLAEAQVLDLAPFRPQAAPATGAFDGAFA